jgi:hypothetical protein
MSDYASKELRDVVLPDWLQECDDFCASCITSSTPRAKAADMWIEHASDMVLKIRQLMVDNATLRQHLMNVAVDARKQGELYTI